MATKSISQLDSAATLDNGDLFETAIPDSGSASGYASKKMSLAQLADYAANDVVYPDFKTSAQSITGAVNQTLLNFADEYDNTATYDVGDVVIYAGNLYKCETAVTTAETFDPTKWTQGKAADFFAGGGGDAPEISGVFSNGGLRLMNGKILNGFYSGNSAYYPKTAEGNKPVYNMSRNFKIHLKVKCTQLMGRSQVLIGNSNNFFYLPSIEFQSSGAAALLWAGWSVNGSAWTTGQTIEKSEIAYDPDAWYLIDYEWNGTTWKIIVSDGINTVTKSNTVSAFYQTSSGDTELGTVNNSNDHYAQYVQFDLSDCFWEEDGVIIWGNMAA